MSAEVTVMTARRGRLGNAGRWIMAMLALVLAGCPALISPYDQVAYQTATSVKAEVLALVEKAGSPYTEHEKKIEGVLLEVEKAYEYAKGLPHNEITAEQWNILKNPDGNLIGGFLRTWRQERRLSKAYVENKKKQLAQAFDYIICLEVNKKEATSCKKTGDK